MAGAEGGRTAQCNRIGMGCLAGPGQDGETGQGVLDGERDPTVLGLCLHEKGQGAGPRRVGDWAIGKDPQN